MFKTLSEWLVWIESVHAQPMELGLTRVREVAHRMKLLSFEVPIVTVAGTNGKGSTVAGLETLYHQAGYRTGVFTSPYLFRFNEQIRLLAKEVSDEILCKAFEKIEIARQNITLTLFEFKTLAALEIFKQADLDIIILEVGLGGRLDAVNIVDSEIAIVTHIDIDHAEILGDTREKIAFEKAGIFRSGKYAISGDFNVPASLIEYAKSIGALLYCQDQQFGFQKKLDHWNWWNKHNFFENLPMPKLLLQNMSIVLMAVELLQKKLPVQRQDMDEAFRKVKLEGRLQIFEGDVEVVRDVSHNPASVQQLSEYLRNHPINGKTLAVFSMLADKDIHHAIQKIQEQIDQWYIAPLKTKRSESLEGLKKHFQKLDFVHYLGSIKEAFQKANQQAKPGDRLLVFGSFYTVSEVFGSD